MVKLPELNRHIVGVSAIALALMGLAYWANMTSDNRRIASLSDRGAGVATLAPEQSWNRDFLSMLKQTPPNVYGSAGSAASDLNAGATRQSSASLQGGLTSSSGAAASKDWTAEDWRIATEAVSKARASAKGQPASQQAANTTASGIIWRPPEEIAGQNGSR